MSDTRDSTKASLLAQLVEQFKQKLTGVTADALSRFVHEYYQVSPLEELTERRMDNLYGATLSYWNFLQRYDGEGPKVRVFNPDFEQHGWHSTHTVIELLSEDMPFLVDSVRMELNRQSLSIHAIHNAVIPVERDSSGQLLRLLEPGASRNNSRRESTIYLEVDRRSDNNELKSIEAGLADVLGDVKAAVGDFGAMRAQIEVQHKALAKAKGVDATQLSEARAFLEWLSSDNFTFLGYDELKVEGQGHEARISRVKDSELGILRLHGAAGRSRALQSLRDNECRFIVTPEPVMFAKDSHRSRVHRPAYADMVVVKHFDDQGNVCGESRFYGLYTSPVFGAAPRTIPVVRGKVDRVMSRSGFEVGGHSNKELLQVIKELPREELFLSDQDTLFETAIGIFNLQERRKVRLFVRPDKCGKFFSVLYFAPRDIYSTDLRNRVQSVLIEQFKGVDTEFTTHFSESVLARTHFVLRVDPDRAVEYDIRALESQVTEISRAWDEELHNALVETSGEEQGNRFASLYRGAFSSAYKEHFAPGNAVYDIQRINELDDGRPLSMSFYRLLEESSDLLRFKLFTEGDSLILSDMIPILENLGLRVVGEHPYEVRRRDGRTLWMHDFTLTYSSSEPVELHEVKQIFQEAFAAIWEGQADNDEFNRLVIGGKLHWREVALLRAYTRYNRQLRFDFSQPYIADTLARHLQVTKLLVALFRARFDPVRRTSEKVEALTLRLEASLNDALELVDNLNDDRILRRLMELIKATLRTNYFQLDGEGQVKSYFSFKIDPRAIADIPRPRPMFETFVYSPRMEGVHLRIGKVARGGLRWSDRLEDYRTEVLGLVKAQQVKNAVIVPVGAKGGFVAKYLPEAGSREAVQAEGIACYQLFIRGLLDLADNLVGGAVVPPVDVVRHDKDDPYLVVAADKGTATFSDIANALSAEYGFWLGDAFASGGSQGYDHKGMGITARGAWVSVKRHFRELGLDTQSEPFSVVGIGDMAGDVFGNGMMLSEHAQVVAAFNHMHIFIDPDPDTAVSFKERQRLFALPRSSWSDYDQSLISAGGGVFSRNVKSIPISKPMQKRFDIQADRLAPNELISALLRAPVDLLWNGGIGTYVKASHESHADVGDKANDGLRINGAELRCRVLGEGGNLGFTQLGRIEYALKGGATNTDFIDNAGGVDCSDHEVNIKILLNEVVASGDMTLKQRNALLKAMTEEVSELVLDNNYRQVQALSVAEQHARKDTDEYIRLIDALESEGKLDRELEFIPSDETLQERKNKQQGLTRPELSVLICYVKAELKAALNHPRIHQDPYLAQGLTTAFPVRLKEQFPEAIEAHRLRKEIIATQLANSMVNRMGITYPHLVRSITGADYTEITAAYVIARDVFGMDAAWEQIEALDYQVPADVQHSIMVELLRLVRRASYWFLRNHRYDLDVTACIERYRSGVEKLSSGMSSLIQGDRLQAWQAKHEQLQAAGVPEQLAALAASADSLFSLLGIIQVAEQTGQPLENVARVYFRLGERLDLHWFDLQIRQFEARSHWQSLACDHYRDDLNTQQRALTARVLADDGDQADDIARVDAWLMRCGPVMQRWQAMLTEMRGAPVRDCAIFSVALRELLELAQGVVPQADFSSADAKDKVATRKVKAAKKPILDTTEAPVAG